MNFEQLLYVEVLSHSQSLAQAANTLHISKSGLSLAISQLEKELGVKLFERSYGGTKLSAAGQQLMRPAINILHSKSSMEQLAKSLQDPSKSPTIKIQYVNSTIVPVFDHYIDQFLKHHHAHLMITCHHADRIVDNVRKQRIDAGLIAVNPIVNDDIDDLQFTPIMDSSLRLIMSPDHVLTSAPSIKVADLSQCQFCLFDDPYNREMFQRLQMICGPLDCPLVTDNGTTYLHAVEHLNLVGIGRYSQLGDRIQNSFDSLKVRTIDELIPDRFTFGLLTNPKVSLPVTTSKFVDGLVEHLRTAADSDRH